MCVCVHMCLCIAHRNKDRSSHTHSHTYARARAHIKKKLKVRSISLKCYAIMLYKFSAFKMDYLSKKNRLKTKIHFQDKNQYFKMPLECFQENNSSVSNNEINMAKIAVFWLF